MATCCAATIEGGNFYLVRSMTLANEPHSPDVAHDLRGWFCRAIAPDSACSVLEVGEAHVGNWFANVTRTESALSDEACAESVNFDIVVIHQSLGGCATLRSALVSARRLLRQGGWLVLSGANRLRPAGRGDWPSIRMPRATGWGFRSALKRAGFADISLHVAHPPDCAPIYVIETHPRSARAFFGAQLAARDLPSWSPKKLLFGALVATNLMPYLQPGFIVVGRRC